jgi:drug/metabolite transporter (DMT)-like permease
VLVPWLIGSGASADGFDLFAGAGAGLFGLAGLAFLYTGLARGRAAVVAPSAAVIGAAIPVVGGVIAGDGPPPIGWIGVAVAVPAIYLVSTVEEMGRRSAGLWFGLAAGLFFGGYFVVLSMPSPASGLWPLLASRVLSVMVLSVLSMVGSRGWLAAPSGAVAWAIAGAGLFDMVGNIGYLLAARQGSLVVVAVVASLYPAVTVLMSRLRYDERLSKRQLTGVMLGVTAVALLSIA